MQDKYLVAIDCDNKKAIEEFVGSGFNELKQKTLVEQHSNSNKMHIYFIVDREIPNKSSDKVDIDTFAKINENMIPALEIKSNGKGIMFCSPSTHKNGHCYTIIGTLKPVVFTAQEVENRISSICEKYKIPYVKNDSNSSHFNKLSIEELFTSDTQILAGHNRHEALLRIMESILQRNKRILPLEKIKKLALEWNQEHCTPPLDNIEVEKQWKSALKFVEKVSLTTLKIQGLKDIITTMIMLLTIIILSQPQKFWLNLL